MAAHKYWRALCMVSPYAASPAPLELSEFQLYSGATRLDAAATLTSNIAPTSGTLGSLKDDATTTGAYWADLAGVNLILSWSFGSAVEVDGVLLGARTTAARFPTAGLIQGGDATGLGDWRTVRGFGGARFVSAAKTGVIALSGPAVAPRPIVTQKDYSTEGGRGLITGTIMTAGTPEVPTFARVRLVRDIDGKVIRETWSNPLTGDYTFDRFDEHFAYSVLSYHPSGAFRAVIADGQIPELMP